LNKGEYEVVFAAYENEDKDGQAELKGTLDVGLVGKLTLDPGVWSVQAETVTTLNVSVLAILP